MNNHPSRLAYLMEKFSVSAKELSAAIHVDHSLISKWRNNKRSLSSRSSHLEQISAYFLSLDAATEYSIINEIIKNTYPHFKIESMTMKSALLKKWILGNLEENNSENLIKTLHTRGSYTAQVDILKGNQGRRQASQRLMDLALSLPSGQELLLYSQSSQADWHVEDKVFYANWKRNYMEILLNGSSIQLIHSINRQIKSLINILMEWLPMELTGNLTSYYFPKYSDSLLKPTLLVIKDKAAVFSMSHEDDTIATYTHFFTDPITIEHAELVFRALLSNCRPLYEKYTVTTSAALLNKLITAEEQHENCYWISTLPILNTLPPALLSEIIGEDKSPILQQRIAIQKHFLRNLQTNRCRIILNSSMLEQTLRLGVMQCSELTMISGQQVTLSQSQLQQYLHHLLLLLLKYPNLEIAFAQETPAQGLSDTTIFVKENTAVMVSAYQPHRQEPITLVSHEPSIINAYYHHLENIWSAIPRIQYERKWVAEKLQRLLEQPPV